MLGRVLQLFASFPFGHPDFCFVLHRLFTGCTGSQQSEKLKDPSRPSDLQNTDNSGATQSIHPSFVHTPIVFAIGWMTPIIVATEVSEVTDSVWAGGTTGVWLCLLFATSRCPGPWTNKELSRKINGRPTPRLPHNLD